MVGSSSGIRRRLRARGGGLPDLSLLVLRLGLGVGAAREGLELGEEEGVMVGSNSSRPLCPPYESRLPPRLLPTLFLSPRRRRRRLRRSPLGRKAGVPALLVWVDLLLLLPFFLPPSPSPPPPLPLRHLVRQRRSRVV